MNVALWVVGGLLALAYLFSGLTKLTRSREQLKDLMPFTRTYSDGAVKAIGAVEVAGALGLVLPQALDIAPVLTPLAATGFVVLQALAIRTHRRLGDAFVVNVVLLVLALFVAVGRFALL